MIIKNALTAFPGAADFQYRDIRVENGQFVEFGTNLNADEILDASDYWVLPGGIDPHVHFYDPGYTEKEDFFHGTSAAVAGGITMVVDMPSTSIPPVTDRKSLDYKLSVVQPRAHCDFAFFGGLSKQLFDAGYESGMESIVDDVLAYKVYSVSGAESWWGAVDHWRFRRILEHAKKLNTIILLHAEDAEYVNNATDYYQNQGKSPREWYDCRPELAEILAVGSALRINQEVGGNLHIVHIGSSEAAEMLQKPWPGATATGETCPQYLAFALKDFLEQGPALKISPPIKEDGNRQRLWELLADGTIEFVASDHAPGTKEEKAHGDIWCNSAGIAGTETILPYLFSEGYLAGRLTLPRYLEVMSEKAARRYGLFDRKGSLAVGKDADMVLIHRKAEHKVSINDFQSKGRVTPFEGMTFRGRVDYTFVRGKVVYDRNNGGCKNAGWGRLQKPIRLAGGEVNNER